MIILICVDDNHGISFNHRRQSKDRILQQHILDLAGSNKLWMNSYSKKQFEESDSLHFIVDEDYLDKAGNGEYCFVEDKDISNYVGKIEKLIVYKWNRIYPADTFLSLDMDNWILEKSEDFAGYSHERITKEIYRK